MEYALEVCKTDLRTASLTSRHTLGAGFVMFVLLQIISKDTAHDTHVQCLFKLRRGTCMLKRKRAETYTFVIDEIFLLKIRNPLGVPGLC